MHWIALQPDAPQGPGADQSGEGADAADATADPLTALGWQALQFTPKVARVSVGTDTPTNGRAPTIAAAAGVTEVLVMEISASERLFGGRERLLRLIHKKNKALAVVKYAQAATALVALADLRMGGGTPYAADAARGKEQIGGGAGGAGGGPNWGQSPIYRIRRWRASFR